MSFFGSLLRRVTERSARKHTFATLAQSLQTTGAQIETRLANAADTPRNIEQAKHIIGIERWGQRRLRCALGQPSVQDEYNSYRPDALTDLAALREAFGTTRAETISLARELEAAGVPADRTMPHNDMGAVTLRGWLSYLNTHAAMESKRITAR